MNKPQLSVLKKKSSMLRRVKQLLNQKSAQSLQKMLLRKWLLCKLI